MPDEFHAHIDLSIADPDLQVALDGNAEKRMAGRRQAFATIPDYQERRQRAHAVRADVIANLDDYLAEYIRHVEENGFVVHRAADGAQAVQIILEIIQQNQAKLVAKSKTMVSEEINLNHLLEAAGLRVVETDLGEFIVQIRGEKPSHIITPAVHLRRGQVGQTFHDKLGVPLTDSIPEMTSVARKTLREVFLTADIGLSGVNFGVIENGTICVMTNEGNGRMVTTVPPVHIALMGMEQRSSLRRDRPLIVVQMRLVGRAHLHHPRPGTPDHVGHAKGASDLHQLAARDNHFPTLAQRGQHQIHGAGVVVHQGGVLAAGQGAQHLAHVRVAVTATARFEIDLQCRVACSDFANGIGYLGCENGPP